MKSFALAALVAGLTASQASALSCLRPDVAQAFLDASSADQTYVVLKGAFDFAPLPKKEKPTAETVAATFSGRLLTGTGFTQKVSAPVQIELTCSGMWCAEMEPQQEMIAFVQNLNDEKLVFEVGPCYELAFVEPSQEDVKRLENCAQGGACEPRSQTPD